MDIGSWDTICVIAVDQINQQLTAKLDQLIQSFDYSGADPFGSTYEFSGTFGPWQVVPGGSNTLIHVQIPVTSGKLVSGSATTDVSGMSVVVEVSLQLLPVQAQGNAQQLTFDFRQAGTQPGDTTPGLVTPISFSDPNNTGKGSLLLSAVVAVLVNNASEVSFVFATIGVVDPSTPSWLTPVRSTYDYSQPVGGTAGYLAILSVTSDRDITGYDTQIDPGLVSSSYPVTFAVSQPLFMQNIVLPILPSAFPNTSAQTFQCSNGVITNTGEFGTPGVTKGAITYHPEVTSLQVTSTDNYLQVATSGNVDLDMPNASMDFSVTAKNVLTYDQGSNTLTFQPDPNPMTSHSNNIPWYDYVLIALTGGIALAIFSIVVPLIASEIADDLNSGSSGIDLTKAPPKTVQWQGMQSFQVQDAGLDDLFYMRGTPVG
jgi:Clostridium P-47 protein